MYTLLIAIIMHALKMLFSVTCAYNYTVSACICSTVNVALMQ